MKEDTNILISQRKRGSMNRTSRNQNASLNLASVYPAVGTGGASVLASCRLQRTRPQSLGFSLIEVIVAVAILSIALVGLAHGISTALGSSKEAEWQTTASMYAAGLIENLRAEGGLIDGETQGDCGPELPLYRWTETITAAGVDGLHQVDVSVLNSSTGKEIYALRTLLFEVPADSDSKSKDPKSKKKSSGS